MFCEFQLVYYLGKKWGKRLPASLYDFIPHFSMEVCCRSYDPIKKTLSVG